MKRYTGRKIFISKSVFERDGFVCGRKLRRYSAKMTEQQVKLVAAGLTARYIQKVDKRFPYTDSHVQAFSLSVVLGYGF